MSQEKKEKRHKDVPDTCKNYCCQGKTETVKMTDDEYRTKVSEEFTADLNYILSKHNLKINGMVGGEIAVWTKDDFFLGTVDNEDEEGFEYKNGEYRLKTYKRR
ncbi:hypothetical protein D3C75_1062460 [compost metagenome]